MPFHFVQFGSKTIEFRLQYSERKTLGIGVQPDLSVIVTAPNNTSDDLEKIKAKVQAKSAWILRQQAKFSKFLPKQPRRQYVSGETHLYLGRQYRLKLLEETSESVKLKSGYLFVTTENKKDKKKVEKLITDWYLARARNLFGKKLEICWEKFKKYELAMPSIRLRQMTKRWGTCSPSRIINLNPDLVKTPSSCIEYVIVHELCHLIHPFHDQKFFRLLQRMMPDWEKRKSRLERLS